MALNPRESYIRNQKMEHRSSKVKENYICKFLRWKTFEESIKGKQKENLREKIVRPI